MKKYLKHEPQKDGVVKKGLEGGGRKIMDSDVEEMLLNWILERRENRLRVLRKLMRKAKIFYDESIGDDECAKEAFVASRGWLEKFMRNGLSLRQRTTTAQKDPACLVNKLVRSSPFI